MMSERRVSYKSINKWERKKVFFLKQISKFRASDNSDLQLNNHGKIKQQITIAIHIQAIHI